MKKLLAPDGGDVQGSSSTKKASLLGNKAVKSNASSSSVPMENRGQWLTAALETLKKERQSQLQSTLDEIQPELSVEPEEGEDYSQEWIRSPEPALKLPTTQFHNKTIKFQPYKTSRPELLVRLERLVYDQLREMPAREAQKREGTESPELLEVKAKHASPKSHKQKVSTTSQLPTKVTLGESMTMSVQDALGPEESRPLSYYAHRKQVYGEVLQGYVAESTIYRSVLSEAQYAYESYIQQLEMRVEELGTKATQVNWREEQMEKQLADAHLAHQQKVDSLQEHMRQLEFKASAAEKERAKMEVELGRQKDVVLQGRKQFDEIKQTCVTLTSSLARMDEEHRQFHQSETARLQEVNHLRSSEQKLNEEIERLQQVVQGMEQAQSSMVNQDVVINLEMSMETLKNEIKRMETTHRQLLQRYAILKTTLDEAFKRWHEGFIAGGGVLISNTSTGNAKFHEEKTRQQVSDLLQPMAPRNGATGNVSHGEHTLALKSSGHGHKLRRETSIKSRNVTNHQTPQQALDKLLVMLEHGANVKIILETLLDHAILSSGPAGSNGAGGGGAGGLVTSAFGTAGSNGPYLDPYDAVTFEMTLNNTSTGNNQQTYAHRHSVVNAGLTPQQTGARTFTYDSAPGEDIFVTQQSQSNSNNSGAGGGLVSFAEEFKSPWHHFEGLGYGDDAQTPSVFQHLHPHPGLHHPYTYNHLPHIGNNQQQQPPQYLPLYLRFHGKIQNLFFAKIEVLRILQEIWQAKQQYDAYMAQFGSDYETAVAQAITFTANAVTNANNIANNIANNNANNHKRSSSQASFDFSNLMGGSNNNANAVYGSHSGANSRVGTAGGVQESAMGVTVLPNLNATSNSAMSSPTALSARRTIVAGANNNATTTNNTASNAVTNAAGSTATGTANTGAVGGQSSASGSRSSTAVPAVRVGSANQYPYPGTGNNNPAATLAVTPLAFYALLPRYLTMTTFLYHYLHHRYPHPAIVIEMGYNVHDCVTRRYAHVSDCRLFAAVLDERLPLDAWDDQRDMLERIRDEVHKEIKMLQSTSNVAVLAANAANAMLHYNPATASNHHPTTSTGVVNVNAVTATLNNLALNGNKGSTGAGVGVGTGANPATNPANVVLEAHARITAENLLRVVKRCLPTKPELSFAKLGKALAMDQQSSRFIDPDTLLYDDLQGGTINHHQVQRSHFLEQLKLQHVNELLSFHKHVFDAIAQFHEVDEVSMTVGKLREALVFADPQKPRAEVNKLLARACGGTVEEMLLQEARRVALPLEEIKRRLRQTLLTKSPPSHTKHK